MESISKLCSNVIEYETPKVVTIHNPSIGLLRRTLQIGVLLFVCLYQLWYAQVCLYIHNLKNMIMPRI